ncbi:MAG: hypothetical protein ABMB14_02155 [Myxococcota bacterium]
MSALILAVVLVPSARGSEVDPLAGWIDATRQRPSPWARLCVEYSGGGGRSAPGTVALPSTLDPTAAVAAVAASAYPGRFEVRTLGRRTVVVQTAEPGPDGFVGGPHPEGSLVEVKSALDAVITLGGAAQDGPGGASPDVWIDRWISAVSEAVGQPVSMWETVQPGPPCDPSGTGPARELLAEVLDCRGDLDVWSFGPWFDGYRLSIHHLWALDQEPVYGPGFDGWWEANRGRLAREAEEARARGEDPGAWR